MKKIISTVLTFALALSISITSKAEEGIRLPANDTIRLMSTLDIMRGDGNGNFEDNETLTREQFVKMMIKIKEPEFVSINSISPYTDVPYSAWSAGYIQRASELGLFAGYPDGSFAPEQAVLPEQVCKIMLKLLNYHTDDAETAWAQNQIASAKSIGLLDNVEYGSGTPITRINAAKIIENTLFTQKKESPNYLINDMEYSYYEDAVIISDKNVQDGYVTTSAGKFKKGVVSTADLFSKGNLLVNKKNEIVYFLRTGQSDSYIIKSATEDGVIVFGTDSDKFLTIDLNILAYNGGQEVTYQTIVPSLAIGDKISIYYDNNEMKFIAIEKNAISDPEHIDSFPVSDNTKIFRNGTAIKIAEVTPLDICYYIKETDTLLVYTKRITGIYENAAPTKDNIKSISVSGRAYEIGYAGAINKLSGGGGIAFGETITLLFGKDNTVVDVVTLSERESITGYLMDCTLAEREDENGNRISEYKAKILLPDGTTNEYSIAKDYTNYECKVVTVRFNKGKAELSVLNAQNNISGTFQWMKRSFNKYKLSENINIIDVASGDYEWTQGKGKRIFPQRLEGQTLSSSNILYANVENDYIIDLILNDYTNDIYEYGVVLRAENKSGNLAMQGTYELNINGEYTKLITTNKLFSVATGNAIKYSGEESALYSMLKLGAYIGNVSSVDEEYAYIGNSKYLLSENVIVYNQVYNTGLGAGLRYEIIPKNQIDYKKNVTAYYDKPEKNGGRIRVIVVKSL